MEGPWCYLDDVVRDPLELEKGMVKIPDDPGLGVIIDEEKVARYRIDF
jgi:L-alanine-DL-glutamate epimerase-like enolase superfamily enzyme